MAKAFLVRWGTQNDFDAIKLQIREIGFTIDNEKMYIGGNDENLHIPNEAYVNGLISAAIPTYKPITGTSIQLLTIHPPGAIAYDSDEKRLIYKTGAGVAINIANTSDIPSQTSFSVKVDLANIDAGDNNSVTLTGYDRPIELIFLNGILCTTHSDDVRKYTVDRTAKTLKINGCSENDIISYF